MDPQWDDSQPIYRQLRDRVVAMILEGVLKEGDPLPSVRALAAEQGANPLTVAKAYQGFQDDGLILVKRGVGMFVAPGAAARLRSTERDQFIKSDWPAIRARMTQLGIDPAHLLAGELA